MTLARIRPLTPTTLAGITDPCGRCGHATTTSPQDRTDHRRSPRPGRRPPERAPRWDYTDEVTDLWGLCGVAAHLNGDVPGYLCFAPADLVPAIPLPGPGGDSADVFDADAAVLTALSVCRDYRGRGLGRDLVRAGAAQLARRQLGMIEVLGTFGPPGEPYVDLPRAAHSDDQTVALTLLPVGFWQALGFRIVRSHPLTPTLRMDIASTERWLPDFAGAWRRFARLVTQPGPPQPASYSDPQPSFSGHRQSLRPGRDPGTPSDPVPG